jgi:hypothetical protein
LPAVISAVGKISMGAFQASPEIEFGTGFAIWNLQSEI